MTPGDLHAWLLYIDQSITFLDQERQFLMARFDELAAAVAQIEQAAEQGASAIQSAHDELTQRNAEDAQIGDFAARLRTAADKLTNARPQNGG